MTIKQSFLMFLVLNLPLLAGVASAESEAAPVGAPEFTATNPADWINSPPLNWQELRGTVVLLDIWTFECWNCYRSFPWLKALEARYADKGLRVVGIHSPEFEREKNRASVLAKVREFGLTHPVMLDNDFAYWRALNNRYWPAFWLVDRQGRLRHLSVGETHEGDRRALEIEARIKELLAEPVPDGT